MNHSPYGGLILALAVSFSLAVGYVAGRLHQHISSFTEVTDKMESPLGTSPLDDTSQSPRVKLNPSPMERPLQKSTKANSFDRYPAAETRSAAGSRDSDNSKYPPRRIGDYLDPDEHQQNENSRPHHIGQFMDPDEPWIQENEPVRVSIGEYIDTEDYLPN